MLWRTFLLRRDSCSSSSLHFVLLQAVVVCSATATTTPLKHPHRAPLLSQIHPTQHSLVYASLEEGERAELAIKERQRLYGEGSGYATLLAEHGFPVTTISIWQTDPEDPTTGSWRKVGEVPLGKLQPQQQQQQT
jgi:hypothetical protein